MDASANDSIEPQSVSEQIENSEAEPHIEQVGKLQAVAAEDFDLLGAERLVMSDSEDDGCVESNINVVEKNKTEFEFKETAFDMENGNNDAAAAQTNVKNMGTTTVDTAQVVKSEEPVPCEKVVFRTKLIKLVDSESEDAVLENVHVRKTKAIDVDCSEEKQFIVRKNLRTLIDSESDEDYEKVMSYKSDNIDRAKELDFDRKATSVKKLKAIKKTKVIKSDTDSEDEQVETKGQKIKLQKSARKFSSLVDSDDSSDEDAHGNDDNNNRGHNQNVEHNAEHLSTSPIHSDNDVQQREENNNKKKLKPMRASAKKALDEMQNIQSEQQRLHREAQISIPYHKPKRRTLQEFLKRRTIIKPQLHTEEAGSPAAEVVQSKSLRMTPEELAEYAKLMEERAKEATEFFKSESESEEEMRDNEGVMATQEITADDNANSAALVAADTEAFENTETVTSTEITAADAALAPVDTLSDNIAADMQSEISHNDDAMLSTSYVERSKDCLESHKAPAASKVVITEVVELPKLDMSDVALRFTPAASAEFDATTKSTESGVELFTPLTENVKRLITEKNLPYSPSLKGDPNMLIDLETGDLIANESKSKGADDLLQRLLETNKARKHKTETVSILSTENGKVEISKLPIHSNESMEPQTEQKPGAAYFKLKENLKSLITKKRLEELQRKQEEEKEHEKCLYADEHIDEEEHEEYPDDPDEKRKKLAKQMDEIMIDEEENPVMEDNDSDEEKRLNEDIEYKDLDAEEDFDLKNEYDEFESGEENGLKDGDADKADSDSDDDDDDDDDDEELRLDGNTKSKTRIITAFQDDSDDEINFLKTQHDTTTILPPNGTALFSAEPATSFDDAENELMGLCSGKFSVTQKTETSAPLMSQIPNTQINAENDETEQLADLCSGTFETQKAPTPRGVADSMPRCNQILSSDEENSRNVANTMDSEKRVKKLTKRMKKRKAKLGFSDDEDEADDVVCVPEESIEGTESVEAVEEEDTEVPATFIDYDSEENEILVEMTKKDCLNKAQDFFEKEAELSESEWGSADEDEKHMDRYDVELGDEDEFDGEKIRTELGQIHARKMLDEDIREVRKLQEMLFEDEEQDGVGRQRQFKWKNAESGFSLDEANREQAVGADGDSGDEENEHLWRKIRYEREQVLKERGLIESSQDHLSATLLGSSFSTTETTISNSTTLSAVAAMGTVKKLNIITVKRSAHTTVAEKKNSPFLISKSNAAMQTKSLVRGSFLVRDKETLSKLAGLTKNGSAGTDELDGTAGAVSIKTVKSKNFVFATLTEEEHETLKRKADDLMNSSNENGVNYMKKPKREPRREKCLIDQLL